jgi:S1-C subfamily serine protease
LPLAPGFLIDHVTSGGPAEVSGLRRGDLLLGGGDRDIRSLADLVEVLSASPGDITLRVKRGEQTTEATIPSGKTPLRS